FPLLLFPPTGARGDSLTILQAPDFVSFQKGDWPISGEMIPDLVALTMGFSVKEVLCFYTTVTEQNTASQLMNACSLVCLLSLSVKIAPEVCNFANLALTRCLSFLCFFFSCV
ncbi:unnamed protein product, partial [Tetraodon nigroviridis]